MNRDIYHVSSVDKTFIEYEYPPGYDTEQIIAERGVALGEAADMYGDMETAEDFGYVTRGLKSRHIQFIALGGTIGTGLFLGIGRAFIHAGPLSLLLGYTITGVAVYAMMQSLGEMATWLPLPGAIPQFCARYVDGAMGFAVGWNSWYQSSITVCAEISAASLLVQTWPGAEDINVAAWISIIIIVIISLNIFAVSVYGEAEFIFSSIKIITIIGLLIVALVIDLGGAPNHDRLGFRYWRNPGAMQTYVADGDFGRFLGFLSTLINAAFSYGGVEMVAVAAGETENPRYNVPKAVRRVFWRIVCFYIFGSLALGVLIPYNQPQLVKAIGEHKHGGAASPWVIAIQEAGIRVLPSIINAVILISASSAANAYLYTGARYLYALAQNRQAPRFFLRCSKRGVPYYCIIFTASVSLLTYMSCSAGSMTVFAWFQNIATIANVFTWISISIAYIRFHAALKAQGYSRDKELRFRGPWQPYAAWFSLIYFTLVTLFNGFYVFPSSFSGSSSAVPSNPSTAGDTSPSIADAAGAAATAAAVAATSLTGSSTTKQGRSFDVNNFITAYIGIPIYLGLFLFWKIFKQTRFVRADEADLLTGKAALDAADRLWPARPQPRNWIERLWYFIV